MNRACRLKILREGNHMKKRIAAGFLLLCLLADRLMDCQEGK